jgi:hypothetical protein
MMSGDDTGVVVPADPGGRRSSSVLGRAVVADALRAVDAVDGSCAPVRLRRLLRLQLCADGA